MHSEASNSDHHLKTRDNILASFLFSCAIVTLLHALFFGEIHFWDVNHAITLTENQIFALAAILGVGSIVVGRGRRFHLTLSSYLFGIIAWFLLDALTRPYSWFHGLSIRGEILTAGCIATFFLLKAPTAALRCLCGLSIAIPMIAFLTYSQGKLLISDDHASFY